MLNILGTVEYHSLNTFLWPLVNELQQLDNGILDVEDRHNGSFFTLRAHVLLVTGDGLAIAQIMGTKSLGAALKPCCMCDKEGTPSCKGRKTTYYFPHDDYSEPAMRPNLPGDIETFHVMSR